MHNKYTFRLILAMLLGMALSYSPIVSAINDINMLVLHVNKMLMGNHSMNKIGYGIVMNKSDCCGQNHACKRSCTACLHAGAALSNTNIGDTKAAPYRSEFVITINLRKEFIVAAEQKPPNKPAARSVRPSVMHFYRQCNHFARISIVSI